MYVLLALSSAVLYGIWEFGIGRYRGRVKVYGIILVSAIATTITYLLNGVFRHDLMLDKSDVLPGLLGGSFNLIATILALKAFARGKMGVVTGVAAASILVPLGYSYLMGEELSRLSVIGIGVTVAGLIAFYVPNMKVKPGETNSVIAIVLAGGAALFWGLATVVVDIGSRVNVAGSLLMSMMPQILFTFVVVAVVHRSWGGLTRRSIAPIAGAGVALALANLAFFTAANEGNLGVVSVLGSLDPIVVALLALIFLKEKMARSDQVALLIVIAGTCLVAV